MTNAISPGLQSARPGSGKAVASRWYRALLFLVVASLLLQATTVQAHVHATPPAWSLAAAHDAPGLSGAAGKQVASAPCALCLEAAMSGHYLPASANALPTAPPTVLGVDPQSLAEFRLLSRTIGWLSRAPPR